jgi:hypothetical protein
MWLLACVIIVCVAFSADFRRICSDLATSIGNLIGAIGIAVIATVLIATLGQWATGWTGWQDQPQRAKWEQVR